MQYFAQDVPTDGFIPAFRDAMHDALYILHGIVVSTWSALRYGCRVFVPVIFDR